MLSTFSIPPNFQYFLSRFFRCAIGFSPTVMDSFQRRVEIFRSWLLTLNSSYVSTDEIPQVAFTSGRKLDSCTAAA